jgi:hypothetical protein
MLPICHLSDRTWQRIWQRFHHGQSKTRTALFERCPPPKLPAEHRPAAHVLAHLQAAFPDSHCPIAAFQRGKGDIVLFVKKYDVPFSSRLLEK